jgi:hypothetical protein
MKIVISESQYQRLIEADEEEQQVLTIPNLSIFGNKPETMWNTLQKYIKKKGNPPYRIVGNLDLSRTPIESLGSLRYVSGSLNISNSNVKSLGDLELVGKTFKAANSLLESLGNLKVVGLDCDLTNTNIDSMGNLVEVGGSLSIEDTKVESFGKLVYVGKDLYITGTPINRRLNKVEIRNILQIGRYIY